MKEIEQHFIKIKRQYRITSKELKEKLGIKGEIIAINLWRGRSPEQVEQGVSPDVAEWDISTLTEKVK